MNTHFSTTGSDGKTPAPIISVHGGTYRRNGTMRAVTLGGRMINTDQIFDVVRTPQPVDEISERSQHDARLVADRKSYGFTDNVLNVFDHIEDAAKHETQDMTP